MRPLNVGQQEALRSPCICVQGPLAKSTYAICGVHALVFVQFSLSGYLQNPAHSDEILYILSVNIFALKYRAGPTNGFNAFQVERSRTALLQKFSDDEQLTR